MRKTIYLILTIMSFHTSVVSAQAKKPTLMVAPAETWCFEHKFTQEFNDGDNSSVVVDYERALRENSDLLNITTKIGQLMADRGFPLKDMNTCIRDIKRSEAEDRMTTSAKSGAVISETPLEQLMNYAKADILVEVAWKINQTGPKRSVTYTLRGIDTYTNKQIAASQGTGAPSFSSEVPVLLEEAVVERMDNFIAQLQDHFDDLARNGREIVLNVRIFDNGSGLSFEDEYDGDELTDIIDNWVAENTVQHRYSLRDATGNRLSFEQVRIPLYAENGRALDARRWATELRKNLSKSPFNITAKVITKGLGRVDLILGEK